MGREEEIVKEREKKLEELRKQKINPYAYRFEKKNSVVDALEAKMGADIKTAGRILTKREIGKIAFCVLQDFTGKIQLVFQDGETEKKSFDFFSKYIDTGDIVGIDGKIIKTKTGEHSILVKNLVLLTKSLLPLPDKWHGLQDKEERYRKRYLDLIMNPEVKKVFEMRSKIFDGIREFMRERKFVEVETPVLQPIYGGTNARPFETKLNALNMKVFMRISNELYLKRLIVGGYERIFEFSPDFRNEGIDKYHNPEFTQVETMWAYADYKDNMDFAEHMVEHVCKKIHGKTKINIGEKEIEFKTPWKRVEFIDAIKSKTGLNFAKIDTIKDAKKAAEKIGIDCKKCDTIGEVMIAVFEEKVQPELIQPTIVYDYPLEAAGLAKATDDDDMFVSSFELIVNGMELGLSYCEQNDPSALESYWKFAAEKMKKGDLEAQPMDKDFINALKIGMPPTSGLGVGIDRLAILMTGSASIRDVIFFPFMKPEED